MWLSVIWRVKLFWMRGTDEYAYLVAYVYDATNDLPVSDAAIKSEVAVGPNFYELLPKMSLGITEEISTACEMKTDDNEALI